MKNALDLTAREAADREYMAKLMSDIDDDIAAGTWVTIQCGGRGWLPGRR